MYGHNELVKMLAIMRVFYQFYVMFNVPLELGNTVQIYFMTVCFSHVLNTRVFTLFIRLFISFRPVTHVLRRLLLLLAILSSSLTFSFISY